MSLARIPDVGVAPERQGPRTKLGVPQIRALRNYRQAGTGPTELARLFDVSVRTVYRYLDGTSDPIAVVFVDVVSQANADYGLGLTATQAYDVGHEVLRRLRMRGWTEGRPS